MTQPTTTEPFTWIETEIEITHQPGKMKFTTPALVAKDTGLAINQSYGAYIVTHIASGQKFSGVFRLEESAKYYLKRIIQLGKEFGLDWNIATVDEIARAAAEFGIGKELREYAIELEG